MALWSAAIVVMADACGPIGKLAEVRGLRTEKGALATLAGATRPRSGEFSGVDRALSGHIDWARGGRGYREVDGNAFNDHL